MSRRILTRTRVMKFGAVVAAGCLVLGACGDDDSDSDGGSASGDSSSSDSSGDSGDSGDSGGEPAPTGDPIKIAYGASMSGPQATNGLGAQAVAEAWQQYTNANGGLLGHPVEITMADTKNTVPAATAVMQGFLDDDSLDAVFLTDLVAEGALGELLTDSPVPIISGGGSSDLLWTSVPGVFQNVSGSDYTIKAYVEQAKASDATTFGWAACAEVAVCQENGGKAMDYAESQGLEVSGVQLASASDASYTAPCLSFIEKGTDSIAFNIGFSVGVRFAADCLQQGYAGTFSVINSGFDQQAFSEVPGFKSSGGTQGFPWWSDAEPVKAYRDAMAEYSPDGIATSGNSTSIWSSFELLKKALETAAPAEVTRETVMAAMYTVKDETLDGLLPQPVTFTEGQPSERVGCSWFFKYNAEDEDPASIEPDESGNGAEGDLASTCIGYLDE